MYSFSIVLWFFISVSGTLLRGEGLWLWQTGSVVEDLMVFQDGSAAYSGEKKVTELNSEFTELPDRHLPSFNVLIPDQLRQKLDGGLRWTEDKHLEITLDLDAGVPYKVTLEMEKRLTDVHRARDGAVWITNRQGRIVRISPGMKVESWEAWDYTDTDRNGISQSYPFVISESPDGAVCVVRQFDYRSYGTRLEGVLIWREGKMNFLQVGHDASTTFAEFLDKDRLLVGTWTRMKLYDVDTLEMREELNAPKDFFEERTQPYAARVLPDESILVFFCLAGNSDRDRRAFAHGGFTQVVRVREGKWIKEAVPLDESMWGFSAGKRPLIFDEAGGLWTPDTGRGLAYRSPEGVWQQFDWRHGVPCKEVVDLVLNHGRLWMRDEKEGAAAVDANALRRAEARVSPWRAIRLEARPAMSENGDLFLLTVENGGTVLRLGEGNQKEKIRIPSGKYVPSQTSNMRVDSEGGLWLFGSSSQRRKVAVVKNGNWEFHPRERVRNMPHHAVELALQTRMMKSADFRIGHPEDSKYPVFSGDGRIVFKNEWGRVCYFDGLQWHAPYGPGEMEGKTLKGHPFFLDGKVAARFNDDEIYVMEEKEWTDTVDDRDPRPWKVIENGAYPFAADEKKQRKMTEKMFETCPLEIGERKWTLEQAGAVFAGNGEFLVGNFGVGWRQLALADLPIDADRRVEDVVLGGHGHLLIRTRGDKESYVMGRVPDLEAGVVEADLGRMDEPRILLDPDWILNREAGALHLQWKLDEGDWSEVLPVAPLDLGSLETKGRHELQVRFFARDDFSASEPVVLVFESTFDLQEYIQTMVVQLDAEKFRDREAASAALAELGKAAEPALWANEHHPSPEVRKRIRKLLALLRNAEPGRQ